MKYNFSIPCNRAHLKEVRLFVKNRLAPTTLSSEQKHLLVLAIDEACANAIIHGNNCNEQKKIKIELELDEAKLSVEIYDVGERPPMTAEPKVDWTACVERGDKGGLGLFIMYKIMDKVSFHRRAEGYACRLLKQIG